MVDQKADAFRDGVLSYKYVSPNLSLLERLYLNDFWDWVAHNVYPDWLAPNVITLSGGACITMGFMLTIAYSPNLCGQSPRWVYSIVAGLFFTYQTLDGSDGKQARRTRSGSALGEVMDHGVDALTTTLVSSFFADSFGLGLRSPVFWIFLTSAQMGFYLSNLTLVHRGSQTFMAFDVMEVQTAMMLSLLATAYVGPQWWSETFLPAPGSLAGISTDLGGFLNNYPGEWFSDKLDFSAGIQAKVALMAVGCAGAFKNCGAYVVQVCGLYMLPAKDQPFPIQEKHAGTGFTTFLHQLMALMVQSMCTLGAMNALRVGSYPDEAFFALLICSCFAFGDIMDRVLIMRVAKVPLVWIPPACVISPLFWIATTPDAAPVTSVVTQWWWLLTAVMVLCHVVYWNAVTRQMANVLGVHRLSIPVHPKKS